MHVLPDPAIAEIEHNCEKDEEGHHPKAHTLALFHLGLGRPGKEGNDVMRLLIDAGRRAIGKDDTLIEKRRRHRD